MKLEEIQTIKSDLLTEEQQNLLNGLRLAYPRIPSGMTDYQIEMFVLQASEQPTWYAVYYQCVLESWTRFKSILFRLHALEAERLKINIKKIRTKALMREGTELSLAQAQLAEHQTRVMEQSLAISIHEMQNSFYELQTFERVRQTAEQHFDKVPPWGDPDQEKARWALRFMFQGQQWRKSLVAGDMEKSVPEIFRVLKEEDMQLLQQFFPPLPGTKEKGK